MSSLEYSSAEESLDNEYYYNTVEDCEPDTTKSHPEYFEYECLTVQEAKAVLDESAETVSKAFQVTQSIAKVILHSHGWKIQDIPKFVLDSSIPLRLSEAAQEPEYPKTECHQVCIVCLISQTTDRLRSLACGHSFCEDCWVMHFEVQISDGHSANIKCMACGMIVPEDFVLALLSQPSTRDKYQKFLFRDHVRSHPQLTICPGPDCQIVIRAKTPSAKQVTCSACKTMFCFICGNEYHAPADCSTIRKWLTKCSEDTETANYLITHTKSCPKCHVSVEKHGGCNHMSCSECGFQFCWMCMKMWGIHSAELYTCSRYTIYSNDVDEVVQSEAKLTVKKYLFYFEKWQNHSDSLRLDEEKLQLIRSRINARTMEGSGTWIDWNFLLDATAFLLKSRNTLRYTYACAYYMEPGPRKTLFEYQQAQMELQIEDLAWIIDITESIDKGALLNHMDTVEKTRISFLKEFSKA